MDVGIGVITSTGAGVGEGSDFGRSAGSDVAGVGDGVCFVGVGETEGDGIGSAEFGLETVSDDVAVGVGSVV